MEKDFIMFMKIKQFKYEIALLLILIKSLETLNKKYENYTFKSSEGVIIFNLYKII
jgi:hypothetical protein